MQSEQDGWRSFLKLCHEAKTAEQLDEYLQLLLTAEERSDIATRYLIIKHLIRNDLTQREMAEQLQVSIAKITRGSNSLKLINEKLRGLLQKIFD